MPAKLSNTEFIQRAVQTHGNRYDYSMSEYVGSSKNIKIICKIHGIFEQTPDNHYAGRGCPTCAKKIRATKRIIPLKIFLKRAKNAHGDRYDYSLSEYVNIKTKIKIICKVHGIFNQTPEEHCYGRGCPKCGIENVKFKLSKSTKKFIEDCKKIHGDNYDYSKVIYTNRKNKIKITCNTCKKDFLKEAYRHLSGVGCPLLLF